MSGEIETVKKLAVKLSWEDANFNQKLKAYKQNMTLADSEFKALGGTVKEFGNTADGTRAHVENLNKKIEAQSQIIKLYKEKVTESEQALDKNSQRLQKHREAITEAQKAYEKNVEELGKSNEKTKKSKENLDKATEAYKRNENSILSNKTSIEKYKTELNDATGDLKKMQAELANSTGFAAIGRNLENVGSKINLTGEKISGLGQGITTGVTLPILAAGTACSKFFTNYENGMAKISTIADTSKISINDIGDSLKSLSNDTGEGITTLQEAEYNALSSGVDTAKSTEFLNDAVKAAIGGFTDANTAVDGLTTVLNAYDKKADDAKEITNEMMVAQNLGKTTFGEMASSIGLVADTTAACNVSTKDLFSSLAVETAHGIDTSEAVSGLREALSNVIKPSQEAQKEAEKLGINFSAAHLKSVGWSKFLQEIADKTGGDTEKMGLLFGSVQGLNTMVTLTSNSGLKLFNQSLGDMNNGVDYVNDAFNKVNNTTGKDFSKSINKLKNDAISLGKTLTPVIDGVTAGINDVHDVINGLTDEQKQLLTKIAEVIAAVGPAVFVTGKLTSGIGKLVGGIGGATKAIGSFVKGMNGVEDVAATAVPTAAKLGSAIGNIGGAATLGIGAFVTLAAVLQDWGNKTVEAEYGAKSLTDTIDKECASWDELKSSTEKQAGTDLAETNQTQNLWEWLQKNVDETGKLKGSKEIAADAVDKINKTTGKEELKLVNGVVQGYKDQKDAINKAIAAKKAQILLEANEEKYKKALTDYTKKQNEQAQLAVKLSDDQKKLDETANELEKRREENGNPKDQKANDLAKSYATQKEILSNLQSEYDKNEHSLDDYYTTIKDYEDASVASSEGNYQKTTQILGSTVLAYTAAGGATKAELENQVAVTAAEAQQMRDRYKAGVYGVTEAMVQDAETRAANAKTEYEKYGVESGQGVANGVKAAIPSIKSAGESAGKATASSIQKGIERGDPFAIGRAAAGSVLDGYLYTINHSNIPSNSIFSQSGNMKFRSLGHNALGTNYWRGGLTWVNEKGPELVNLPQGTQIVPHDATMEMARAAGDSMARISALMSTPNVIVRNNSSSSSTKFDINVHVKTDGNISDGEARRITDVVSNEIALKLGRR